MVPIHFQSEEEIYFINLLHPGEDSLGLTDGLDLLIASLLTDVEVLDGEVAGLVEIGLLVGKLLQFGVGLVELSLSLGLVALGGGAGLGLVHLGGFKIFGFNFSHDVK
jgi:hypothetical protein